MLKKTVNYEDFNGDDVKATLYFHLTTPEVTRLTFKCGGDISEYATNLVESGKTDEMLDFIEELILSSYGEKSQDGKTFTKTKEVRDKFEYSAAYAQLFEDLLTQPGQAQAFGEGLVASANKGTNDKVAMIAAHKAKQEQGE